MQTTATRTVVDALPYAEMVALLDRHYSCDWGTVDAEDAAANRAAVKLSNRILSRYPTSAGKDVWVITEADRSVTTIMFLEEY